MQPLISVNQRGWGSAAGETCVVDRSLGGAGEWQRAAEGQQSMFHRRGDKALERRLLHRVRTSHQYPMAEIKGQRGPMCGQILRCRFR